MDSIRIAKLKELINKIGDDIAVNSNLLTVVNEALTHSSISRGKNYEKLEFLGDAVLRLAATEFIGRNYPDLSVGARSSMRAQLVSDRWLADVGAGLAIEQHMLLGRQAQGDRSAQSRLQADATEALIGALYTTHGDLKAIHRWLSPTGMQQPKRCWPPPTSSTAKQPCKSGARVRGSDCLLTAPTNAARCMETPSASTAG